MTVYDNFMLCLLDSQVIVPLLAGDPDVILKVPGRKEGNPLDGHTNCENIQPLNLM